MSKKNQDSPTYQIQAEAALGFLKKCYEIGNKPVWQPLTAREKAALKKRRRETLKTNTEIKKPTKLSFLCGEIISGHEHRYMIGEKLFVVTPNTWIIGDIKIGSVVEVSGKMNITSELIAKKVTILK